MLNQLTTLLSKIAYYFLNENFHYVSYYRYNTYRDFRPAFRTTKCVLFSENDSNLYNSSRIQGRIYMNIYDHIILPVIESREGRSPLLTSQLL